MRKLGQSDLMVSELGFGCMSLGSSRQQADRLLRQAYEAGINFFDTADLYDKGQNEELLGEALKPFRKEVILATKVGNQWRPDGSGWDWNPRKAYILQSVDQSLRRLQTDYIDLYQLHGGTIEDPIDETIEAFERLKEQGKIRHYGISSVRPNVIREYVQRSSIVSVMMQYSLLDHRPEEEVLGLLEEHGIAVITRGAIAQGRLLGEKEGAYLSYDAEEVKKAMTAIQKLALDLSLDPMSIALGYVLSHNPVASAITGFRTDEQLSNGIEVLKSLPRLTKMQLAALKQQVKLFTYEQHR